MIDPTDQDIAKALRLAGLPGSAATLRDFKTVCAADEEPTHLAQSVLAHARTIANLRTATEALERLAVYAEWDTFGSIAKDALTQIKDTTHAQ